MNAYTIPFSQINLIHLPQVGGKNASLGEMFNKLHHPLGIEVLNGFALTVESYHSLEEAIKLVNEAEDKYFIGKANY